MKDYKVGSLNQLDDLPEHVYCEECGEEIQVNDVTNIPETCGKLMCVKNHEYRNKRWSDRSEFIPTPEEARKF